MDNFDKHFKNLVKGIPDHKFKHYNDALGCMIYSKEHYKAEMKARNIVPYEMVEETADKWHRDNKRDYEKSDKCRGLINFFKDVARRRNGYIDYSEYPKVVKELKSMGVDLERDINQFLSTAI